MTRQSHTMDRPTRIAPVLRMEIEQLNEQRFGGKLPFARASEAYVEKNKELEKELERLRQQYGGKRGRLV